MHVKLTIKYSVEDSITPCCAQLTLGLPRQSGTEMLPASISRSNKYLFGAHLNRWWGEATEDGFRERSHILRRTSWEDVEDEVGQVTKNILTILNDARDVSARLLSTKPLDSISTIYIPEARKEVPRD